MQTDFLIIGSGIAGLSYAFKVAEHFSQKQQEVSITIITKADEDESNTKYAQGGIAAVTRATDSFEKHVKDTLVAGAGVCDEEVVRLVVEEAPARINELIEWGANFDKTANGEYDLAKEGGHSDHRILHYKDVTGYEIERALINKVSNHPYITILNHHFAVDLITQHHLGTEVTRNTPEKNCFGAYILDKKGNTIFQVLSKVTMLATGGVGQAYLNTTNPVIATGDGIAMAYRAKATIKNMEFVQFHPTALYDEHENPSFLISEAVRGAGAVLRTQNGDRFMAKYDEREDLAPRDIVARAIDSELKKSGDRYVYLDATQIGADKLHDHFPNILKKCASRGIDITTEYIPVVPAAHYLCGGVAVDQHARTSIEQLYACGECACTGLHGANRLASNSLLEAVVYSHRAYLSSVEAFQHLTLQGDIPDWDDQGTRMPNENIQVAQTRNELRTILSNYVGIVRSGERLNRALSRLKIIYDESEKLYEESVLTEPICQLRNLGSIAYLITMAAQDRSESVGLHYMLQG